MPQTAESSSKSTENIPASVERSEKITSSDSQLLTEENLISEELPLLTVESSGKSTTTNTPGQVFEDSSLCADNDTVDLEPTSKNRKFCTIIKEENNDNKQNASNNSSDDFDSEISRIIKNPNEITSDNSFSSSKTLQEESSIHEDIASDMTEISQDARLSTIIGELSTSVESLDSKLEETSKSEDTSTENTSKSEDSCSTNASKSEDSSSENASKSEGSSSNTSKSEDSSSTNTSKSEDSSSANTSKSDDSITDNSSKSKYSSTEDSSKSEDSNSEDSSKSKHNSSTDSTIEQTSEDTESDSCKKDSNQNRKTRKRKISTVCESKENSDSDKETSSSGNTHKEPVAPNKKKQHSEIRRPSAEYFPLISEDSSESGGISIDESSKDTESYVSGKGNSKQALPTRKRKLSTVCEVTEGNDSEEGTSSDSNDSRRSIKRLKTSTKMRK